LRRPPRCSTLSPYTTLFRSFAVVVQPGRHLLVIRLVRQPCVPPGQGLQIALVGRETFNLVCGISAAFQGDVQPGPAANPPGDQQQEDRAGPGQRLDRHDAESGPAARACEGKEAEYGLRLGPHGSGEFLAVAPQRAFPAAGAGVACPVPDEPCDLLDSNSGLAVDLCQFVTQAPTQSLRFG